MSLPIRWKWLSILPLAVFLFYSPFLSVRANNNTLDFPRNISKEHHKKILLLSSDKEALEFSQRIIPKHTQSKKTSRQTLSKDKGASHHYSQKIQTTITRFLAALTTLAYIHELRAMPQTPLDHHFFSKNLLSKTQQQWILSKAPLNNLKLFLDLQARLSEVSLHKLESFPPNHDYAQFVFFQDQVNSAPHGLSWIQILENLGMKGVRTKLHEYWDPKNHETHQTISDSQKQSYTQKYITSRLLSTFRAHLLAQAMEVEAQVSDVAWESWQDIQQWHQDEQAQLASMRLCGNWKWIIHNHQNHGDHKTTMTFHPLGFATPSQVQPTTILIHGDTVYLKWTFPQGIQEDSLLLSNHDARLEGSFTNSLGPYGSISGQRLSACPR